MKVSFTLELELEVCGPTRLDAETRFELGRCVKKSIEACDVKLAVPGTFAKPKVVSITRTKGADR